MSASIEVTTRYATGVDDLPAAWAFVMEHIDKVGDSPSVTIDPVWTISSDDPDGPTPRHFTVVVSGMVEHEKADAS